MVGLLPHPVKQSGWQTGLVFVLAFWLSGIFLLDGLVMPSLYFSGMMTEPGFAVAGYSLFWLFNRLELVCAAMILTGVLGLRYTRHPWHRPGQVSWILATLLLAIALIETYTLTPNMSALGLQLDYFTAVAKIPVNMELLHIGYWLLDLLKLGAGSILVWRHLQLPNPVSQA